MTKTIKHKEKQNYLLDKGIEILWSNGYNGTSINDLVKAAGVPKGSFYFYFGSKEDFVVKALHRYYDTYYKPVLDTLTNGEGTPKERILNFYEIRVNALKEELDCKRSCLACTIGNEMSEHSEVIRNTIVLLHRRMTDQLTKVAEEAAKLGEISPYIDVPKMIGFIEDATKGAMLSMKETQSAYPIDNAMNIIKHILLR